MKTQQTSVLTLIIALVLTSVTTAQSDEKRQGAKAKRAREARAANQEGEQKGRRNGPNSEMIVARMMQQFDRDGDQKLDTKELTALLTFMRERGGRNRQGMEGRPGARGPGAARRGSGASSAAPGSREPRSRRR